MCGIIGYKGSREASKIILDGLKSLEYRGYDSVGIAVADKGKIEVRKGTGKIADAEKRLRFTEMKGSIGIGHTRWATHGGVTEENAHPHLSNDGRIAVVHNGIIENFQELRKMLEDNGFKFKSETDTEVIPNLMQYYIARSMPFEKAFVEALRKLRGSFAIVSINRDGDRIAFGKRGSPLCIGIGKSEYFIASDVPAFLEHSKNVIYLEDNEYGFADGELEIYNVHGKKIEKKAHELSWDIEQAKKGHYDHFTIKEINEQPESIIKAIKQDPDIIKKATDMLKDANGIFFIGCGTSFHACVSASYTFSNIAKRHVNVVLASEFRNYEDFLTPKTLVICLTQSGETADVIDALNFAKKHSCKTIAIVNVMGSTITRMCGLNVMMNVGPEISVVSTKAYTAELAILTLLAYSLAGRLSEGKKLITKAANSLGDVIRDNDKKLAELAKKIKDRRDMFLIGRDLAYPSALEGALKIKEISYIHAEGFAGAELKHGSIALIEKGVPVIVFSTEDTKELIRSNAMEVKARGAFIIGIGAEKNEVFDIFIDVPSFSDADPIAMIVPVQILAYYLAVYKGYDPDKPRNLAKSVTVR